VLSGEEDKDIRNSNIVPLIHLVTRIQTTNTKKYTKSKNEKDSCNTRKRRGESGYIRKGVNTIINLTPSSERI